MPQDAFTLKYLCHELNDVFAGGKINRIVQPNNDEVVFTVYTGKCTKKLSLNVNPASPRIGIVNEEKDSPLTAPNFCMLLRKHLLSATINNISLVGFDRIVKIDLTPSCEFFDDPQKSVYVELMGRYSNVILTENDKILGGNRGINVFDDGVRPLFVGKNYLFPPVGDKLEPTDKSLIDYYNNHAGDEISKLICSKVQGVALSTAKEIQLLFFQEHGKNFENFGEKLFKLSNKFLYNVNLNPCVIFDGNGVLKDVCVYPYKCIEGEFKCFDTLWEAEQFYFDEKEKAKQFKNNVERAKSIVSTQIKKLKKKFSAISAKEKEASLAENNRIFGELILSNIYMIKQGQSSCSCYDYYNDKYVDIPLDARLSPSKNAEVYFKKYNKQKRTLIAITPQKESVLKDLAYFNSVMDELELCETIDDLSHIYLELEQVGIIKPQNKSNKQVKYKPFREYNVLGFIVLVGRNNTENDKLTFSSQPSDVWLHVKDYHSSHVIIKTEGKEVSEEVIIKSASICAYYSKCRESGKAEVVYTLKKHVNKPSKTKPGFCIYDNFKSISVTPDKCVEFLKT